MPESAANCSQSVRPVWVRARWMVLFSICWALTGCNADGERRGRYLSRQLAPTDIHGTWTVVSEGDDLSELNESQGLSPLRLKGKKIVLNSEGSCILPLESLPEAAAPDSKQQGSMRHPTEICLWTVGDAATEGQGTAPAVHLAITQAGYSRGVIFFIYETDKVLTLWARRAVGGGGGYLELRRQSPAVRRPPG